MLNIFSYASYLTFDRILQNYIIFQDDILNLRKVASNDFIFANNISIFDIKISSGISKNNKIRKWQDIQYHVQQNANCTYY